MSNPSVPGETGRETDVPPVVIDACWKRIGIWGNQECPELKTCTHCRNCPIFSASAARLLDRPLPPGYRSDWTGHFSDKKDDVLLNTLSVLVFVAGGETCAIPMRALQEVVDVRAIRTLPHRRQRAVLGLVNVRGELVITVSLAAALGIPDHDPAGASAAGPAQGSARLLIAAHEGERLAFPVQEILGITRVSPSELKDLPATVLHGGRRCTGGVFTWKGRSIGFLDEHRLFQLLNRSLG